MTQSIHILSYSKLKHFWLSIVQIGIILMAVLFIGNAAAQQVTLADRSISVAPMLKENIVGLQSYAIGTWEDEWVIIGGRTDGLHERQPFASFDDKGRNNRITVYNINKDSSWSVSIDTSLSQHNYLKALQLMNQLKSSNIQFAQYQEYLILIGGYGLDDRDNHVTFNHAIIIHLPSLIASVKQGKEWWPSIQLSQDNHYEVCGGRAMIIKDTLFLVGGHSFMGSYNPDGPDSGPGFVQKYTDAARIFLITKEQDKIKLDFLHEIKDSLALHKRDYNLLPYYHPKTKSIYPIAISGVFRQDSDRPWIDNTALPNGGKLQRIPSRKYFNQYHCAGFAAYDQKNKKTVQYFFGGISQYDVEDGILTNDYNVPFTNQISSWVGHEDGTWSEYLLSEKMPGLIGSGAEFIPIHNKKYWKNGLLQLNKLPNRKELVGYIYGGIVSDSQNIFWVNDGTQSRGYPGILGVYIEPNSSQSKWYNPMSNDAFYFEVYPFVGSEVLEIKYSLLAAVHNISYSIKTLDSKVIYEENLTTKEVGNYQENIKVKGIGKGAILYVTFLIDGKSYIQKIKIDKNN